MSLIKKNILFNTLLSLSQILFPLLTFPYASRILGPAVIGKVNFIDSLTQYFVLFSAIGIPLYAVRELSKIRNDSYKSSKLFTELLLLHLATTFFFLLVYVGTILLIKDSTSYLHLGFIGFGILISNVFIIEWYFQSQEKFEYITKRTLLLRFVFIGFLFLIVKNQSDVTKYYSLFLMINIINAGLNFYLAMKSGVTLVFTNLEFKKHVRPLVFLTACSVIGSIYVLLDNVILGMLSTSQSVGYYSTSVKITKIPISLISALGIVLVPSISKSFSDNDFEAIKYYINNSIQYVLTLGIPMAVGIALTAKWTVLIIAGSQFAPAIQLIPVLSPIVVLIAINCIFFFQLFTPGAKESTMLIILGISSFVSVSLNLVLIPHMQHLGTAITTTVTELTVCVLSLYYSKTFYNITLKIRYFIPPLIASATFVPIIFFIDILQIALLVKLLLGASACSLVYYLIQRVIFKDDTILRMETFAKSFFLKVKI
jgi:O-antigen/teichoic acid export membrane protein